MAVFVPNREFIDALPLLIEASSITSSCSKLAEWIISTTVASLMALDEFDAMIRINFALNLFPFGKDRYRFLTSDESKSSIYCSKSPLYSL